MRSEDVTGLGQSRIRKTTLLIALLLAPLALPTTNNAIWGFASPGEKVTVTASWGAEASAVADKAGNWKVSLKSPACGTGHTLTIRGKNTIKISDVAIGEVWRCAGQSNMGWSTGNSAEAELETNVNLPNYRIFKSAREHWHEPLKEKRDLLQIS